MIRRILSLSLVAGVLAALLLAGTSYSREDRAPASAESPSARAAAAEQVDPSATGSACQELLVSEQQAHRAVWELPEVEAMAEEIRARGLRPFTMTSSEPEDGAPPGTEGAAYVIYFGEDHGTHTVHVATFLVDPETGQVTVSPSGTSQAVY